jgi:hypothetical protein
MTGIEEISNLEGKRVRLRVGDKDYKTQTETGIGQWIAGDVPIGTVGTIRPFSLYLMQIVWDGITPKEGYVFGVNDATLFKLEIMS